METKEINSAQEKNIRILSGASVTRYTPERQTIMKTDVLCFLSFYLEGLFNSEMFRSLAFCRAGGTCVDLFKDVRFFQARMCLFFFFFFF